MSVKQIPQSAIAHNFSGAKLAIVSPTVGRRTGVRAGPLAHLTEGVIQSSALAEFA